MVSSPYQTRGPAWAKQHLSTGLPERVLRKSTLVDNSLFTLEVPRELCFGSPQVGEEMLLSFMPRSMTMLWCHFPGVGISVKIWMQSPSGMASPCADFRRS
jgi:hypothetical protein